MKRREVDTVVSLHAVESDSSVLCWYVGSMPARSTNEKQTMLNAVSNRATRIGKNCDWLYRQGDAMITIKEKYLKEIFNSIDI